MADSLWARTGTAALHTFVERLNVERRAKYGKRKGGVRDTKLVVLCLDTACVEEVSRYKDAYGRDGGGGYAYGGYMWNRPEEVRFFPFYPFYRTSVPVPAFVRLKMTLTFRFTDLVRLPRPSDSPFHPSRSTSSALNSTRTFSSVSSPTPSGPLRALLSRQTLPFPPLHLLRLDEPTGLIKLTRLSSSRSCRVSTWPKLAGSSTFISDNNLRN